MTNDEYPEPLNWLMNEIEMMNKEYWVENRPKLNGAEEVRRTGLTTNQKRWADKIAQKIEEEGDGE